MYAPSFVNQQRRTNRGTYALLAGDYPMLRGRTPKMSGFSALPPRRYLPGVLRDAGYRTAYLQSATLSFMSKEPFLRTAGFDQVLSAEHVRPARAHGGWGIDDRTLFEEAFRKIVELEKTGGPWMLTVLTAGTHHPYRELVPESFKRLKKENDEERAYRYADESAAWLVDELERSGRLRNTLVIVTSDESFDARRNQDQLPRELGQHWGVFIALPPTGESGPIEGVYGQSDLALSVADYLGLNGAAEHFTGRSLFRRYDAPRDLPIGQIYARRVGLFDADGYVHFFTQDMEPVTSYRVGPRPFMQFWANDEPIEHPGRGVLAELLRRQDKQTTIQPGQPIDLLTAGTRSIYVGPDGVSLAGWQAFSCEEDAVLHIDLDLSITGSTAPAKIWCRVAMAHEEEGQAVTLDPIEPGSSSQWRLRYRTGQPERGFRIGLHLETDEPATLDLKVNRATLRIVPVDQPEDKLQEKGILEAIDSSPNK